MALIGSAPVMDREAIERAVRERLAGGEVEAAVEAMLRGYGPEVYGYLVATLRDESEAAEVFSAFSEDAWKGLARFDFTRGSLRTWLYVLARHAAARHRRRAQPRAVPLSQASAVARVAAEVRTVTQSFLRTERRSRLTALRDALPVEDREVLILRLDRGLAWDEVARVMLGDDASADALRAESARVRKRFQLVKERLRAAARSAGIVSDGEAG
jgi:RNA polymerase sigma-70 factor (ECF subfamily)